MTRFKRTSRTRPKPLQQPILTPNVCQRFTFSFCSAMTKSVMSESLMQNKQTNKQTKPKQRNKRETQLEKYN
jgi:hypothetical protein